jgi:hypothetical protein
VSVNPTAGDEVCTLELWGRGLRLLGSVLWYRPGLFQRRFRIGINRLYRALIARFTPAKAGFAAGPGRQHNCPRARAPALARQRTFGALAR